MAKPRNSTEAIAQRLLVGAPDIAAVVADRITPNMPTQEGQKPYVAFWRIGGGGTSLLTESPRLSNYLYRVECYAETDAEAEALMDMVSNRLAGNALQAIPPWADRDNGIQACRPSSDRDTDSLGAESISAGQTFSLWFCLQPQA